jgi:dolichyl-phosphate-mannose--protein O-mannosyl transferase
MKAYVLFTGAIFGLLAVAHVWRIIEERQMATEPWYLAITLASAVMCAWAIRLVLRSKRSGH